MYVAICDDEDEFILQIENNMKKLRRKFHNLRWKSFSSAEQFLAEYESNRSAFDVLITDIEMGGIDGVEMAMRIREHNRNIVIFFITSHINYAIKCFSPEPMNFWVKPVDYETMETDFRRAAERIAYSLRYITVMEQRVPVSLNIKDIVYIEKVDRKTELHMTDGIAHSTNKLISHIYTELPGELFVMAHQSFIVNLSHIKMIKDNELVLRKTDKMIPIGRTYGENLRKRFIAFRERRAFGA